MEELNEMTVANEDEIAVNGENEVVDETDVKYADAGVVLGVGMVAGALALKSAQMVWNSKPVKKMRCAAADKMEAIQDNVKARKEERNRKKLAKLKNEVIDVEVIPKQEAANE